MTFYMLGSQGTVVVDICQGNRLFSSAKGPEWLWYLPSPPVGTSLFPGLKQPAREVDHTSSCGGEVKDE